MVVICDICVRVHGRDTNSPIECPVCHEIIGCFWHKRNTAHIREHSRHRQLAWPDEGTEKAPNSIVETMDALRRSFGHYFDGIDPDEDEDEDERGEFVGVIMIEGMGTE